MKYANKSYGHKIREAYGMFTVMRYSGTYIFFADWILQNVQNFCLDFANISENPDFGEVRLELWKKISVSVKNFANSRHWKSGICEIFCRIQTMQLSIKNHDPMAEYQDDGTAKVTVTTGTCSVHKIPNTTLHTTQLAQFNSFVLSFIGFM